MSENNHVLANSVFNSQLNISTECLMYRYSLLSYECQRLWGMGHNNSISIYNQWSALQETYHVIMIQRVTNF